MVGVKSISVNEDSELFSVTRNAPNFLGISILMFVVVAVVNIKMTFLLQ